MSKYFMSETRWSGWERMMMDPSRRPEPPRPKRHKRGRQRRPGRQTHTTPQAPSREVMG